MHHLVDVHKEFLVVDKFVLIIWREKFEQMLPCITVDAAHYMRWNSSLKIDEIFGKKSAKLKSEINLTLTNPKRTHT